MHIRSAICPAAGEGRCPFDPRETKGMESVKRVKPVRSTAVVVRVFPEERDILRFNAGLHGMSMSDYIRQTCPGIRVRKTPEEKRRLKNWSASARTSTSLLARWANTCKRAAEAVEVLTALADIERRIAGFASCASTDR